MNFSGGRKFSHPSPPSPIHQPKAKSVLEAAKKLLTLPTRVARLGEALFTSVRALLLEGLVGVISAFLRPFFFAEEIFARENFVALLGKGCVCGEKWLLFLGKNETFFTDSRARKSFNTPRPLKLLDLMVELTFLR